MITIYLKNKIKALILFGGLVLLLQSLSCSDRSNHLIEPAKDGKKFGEIVSTRTFNPGFGAAIY